jgi:tRNA 2-selenouridine synthase
MRASECLDLQADLPVRVALLREEYAHFLADPDSLRRQLDCLTALLGRERIARWKALVERGDWDDLVAELLVDHYDPAYTRSLGRNYVRAGDGRPFRLVATAPDAMQALARDALGAYPGGHDASPGKAATT